jgi:hypothetical protein
MSEVHELEKQRENYKKLMHKRDLALKLQKSSAFKELILDEYCTKECSRYVGVAGDPAISKEDRDLALEMGKAAQHFKRWLEITIRMGDQAEYQMPELDNAIETARVEEGE